MWSDVPLIKSAWQSFSLKIVARYACNWGSISGEMKASRFLVLKTKWTKRLDKDCGMVDPLLYAAPLGLSVTCLIDPGPRAGALGPGLHYFAPLGRKTKLRCNRSRPQLPNQNFAPFDPGPRAGALGPGLHYFAPL